MITASKIDLGLRCLHWVDKPSDDVGSVAASVGSYLHSVAEAIVAFDVVPAVPAGLDVPAQQVDGIARYARRRQERVVRAEVTYALDPAIGAARVLGLSLERDYRAADTSELVGTADFVIEDNAGIIVGDYKTGRNAPTAEESEQLRFLATAIACHRDDDAPIRSVIVHVLPDGRCHESWHEYSPAEIDEALDAYTMLAERLRGEREPSPGWHCSGLYCPHRKMCEAYAQLGSELVPIESPVGAIASPQRAAELLLAFHAARDYLEGVEAALKAFARANGGIATEPGKVWRASTSARESIDMAAIELLAGELDAEQLELVAPRSCSKTTLGKLGREAASKLMTMLRESGHVRRTEFERFAVVNVKNENRQ